MADTYHTLDGTNQNFIAHSGGGHKPAFITSKGVLWATQRIDAAASLGFYYSADNGDTWTYSGAINAGEVTCGIEYSVYCDEYDMVHVAWARYGGSSSDGRTDKATIYYRFGQLAANHRSFATWSTPYALGGGLDYWHAPDVVAHRHDYDGDIRVHVVWNYNWASSNRHIAVYSRLRVGFASGTVTSEVGASFLQDGTSSTNGKMSIELRHSGDGKKVYRTSDGVAHPDVFLSWSYAGFLWMAQMIWTSGITWTQQLVQQLDTGEGNVPGTASNYGGLYEHHRWHKVLYDPRDDRWIVVGWLMTQAATYQSIVINELNAAGVVQTRTDFGNWQANTALPCAISGSATLDSYGNVIIMATVVWTSYVGRGVISRPKGSNTRTWTYESIDGVSVSTDGARAYMLQYPQSEEHNFVSRSDNSLIHWRTARASNTNLLVSGAFVKKAKFRFTSAGDWVPAKSRVL